MGGTVSRLAVGGGGIRRLTERGIRGEKLMVALVGIVTGFLACRIEIAPPECFDAAMSEAVVHAATHQSIQLINRERAAIAGVPGGTPAIRGLH